MAKPTTDELKEMARETFGRELSDAQAEAYRSCLVERGYSEFTLTEEERAKLASLKPDSNEYQAYLYSLGTAAHLAK